MMSTTCPSRAELLGSLPPEWPHDLSVEITAALHPLDEKVVVLDDDPTGTQTVHGIPVLTEWGVERLRAELENGLPAFYVLTNTRSLTPDAACAINREVGRNLVEAARQAGRRYTVVSRGDSALRGHFPAEVEALSEAVGGGFDGWLLVPFFLEGGRYTIGDVHYVAVGDKMLPAGESEYARDRAFGYHSSDLRSWVEEKTGGGVPRDSVASITLDDLRVGGPDVVIRKLMSLTGGAVCVANGASMRDMQVLVLALLRAEEAGKRFLCRTASSFVPVRAGIEPKPLLTPGEIEHQGEAGALIAVGSYVPRTSEQVRHLLALPHIRSIEVRVDDLLQDDTRAATIARVSHEAERQLKAGEDVVIYTSRALVTSTDPAESLYIGGRVSSGLVAMVRGINVRPRYFLAKGGITSSDMATKALDVRRAMVLGQIMPGVPVWQTGPESRYPGLAYVVFPGNVGGPTAVADIVAALRDN